MEPKDRWDYLKKEYKNQEIVEETEDFEEPKEMTEGEKIKVKKQMMFLVWLIILIIVGIILFYVVSGMMNKKDNDIQTNNRVEEKLHEPLPEGEIDISNSIIQEINNMYDFNINNPLYEENILKLFSDEKVEINNLDFQTKMLLITSNKIFKEYMLEKTNLKDYKNKEVSITKEKLEELSNEIFGKNINLEHNDFKYYYEKDEKVIYFNADLQDDKYVFTETTGEPSLFRVYMNLYYVNKVGTELIIRYQVLFVNNNGIYQDKEMTNLISTDQYNVNNYLNKANMYDFGYEQSDIYNYFLNTTNPSIYLVNKEES